MNPRRHNPVAKFAHRVNRPAAHRDRTAYTRRPKHPHRSTTDAR